jgi:hypothetical protein
MNPNAVQSRSGGRAWALLSLALFALVVAVNALANILPINGVNTGVLSDEIPNLFVPAGLTFSIWGLIYLLLAGYVAALLVEAFGRKPTGLWDSGDGRIFALNMAANAAWILAWHYRLVPLSFGIMLVILTTLVALEERSRARRIVTSGSAPKAPGDAGPTAGAAGRTRAFLLSTPINVYLGWICVATIANVTAVLVKAGWNGFGLDPRAWTVIAIAAGAAVALLLVFLRKAVAAPLVVVWAYAGIVIKRTGVDQDYSRAVWIAALAAAAVIIAALAWRLIATRRKP